MALRFVIGRAGSGKSRLVLDEIRERLERSPKGHPLVLLVPEQATFQAEQSLAADCVSGGYIRAQVFSFRRLAWRVMQETGDTAGVPISDLGKSMLLQQILHRENERFKRYRDASEQTGFADGVNRFFKELKRCGISADMFAAAAEMPEVEPSTLFGEKLHDLSLLYRSYEKGLSEHFLDCESFLTYLAERVEQSSLLRDAEIWVDGFFGFTSQELDVLARCAVHSRRLTVTLVLDREYSAGETPDEFSLFYPSARSMLRLQERISDFGGAAEPSVVLNRTFPPRFVESPMLAHLEAHYENRLSSRLSRYLPSEAEAKSPQISIRSAVHRRAEVDGCVREMLRLVRDEGLRWRDLSIRVRDLGDYADLLASVLTEAGIPFFMDRKRSVTHHPVVEFIRSALEAVNNNWRYEAVFRCVKTDLLLPLEDETESRTDADLDHYAMDSLENYVLSFGIQGSRWKDDRSWTLRRSLELEDDPASASSEADHAFQTKIRACRDHIVGILSKFEAELKSAEDVRGQAMAVYHLLDSCRAAERLERWGDEAVREGLPEKSREHSQVWDSVMDVLDELVELMGGETMPPKLFGKLVETGLETVCLGLVPPSLDQVLIGTIDRTRTAQKKVSFILGVNEGCLPAKPDEDGIFSDAERERLRQSGLDMPDGIRRKLLDEQLLIYSALCSPSRHLWISYPLADEEGRALHPSEIVKQIKAVFPFLREELLAAEPAPEMTPAQQLSYLSGPDRALSYLFARLKMWMGGREAVRFWWEVYNWFAVRPEWRQPLERMQRSLFYANREDGLHPETSRLLYGSRLKASVSRMERYVSCPFSHFAANGLKLRERKIYRLEAPDIGQLFHAALSQVVREIQLEQLDWAALPAEGLRERATAVVDRLSPRLQGEILLSSSRYRYIARKLKEIVGRASFMIAEHARGGGFEPIGLEIGFGPGEQLPPLTFRLDNGATMEIIGRIDRVDRAESEEGVLLRVIDYKSSDTSLKLADLYYGLSLQMLTYLDVVVSHSEEWLGRKARPAGVLYFHVHNPLLQSSNGMDPETAEAELRKRFKMKGLVLADAGAIQLMDAEMGSRNGHSQVIPVALKADGSFYKNASVASVRQWDLLRGYVRQVIRGIGTEITNGNVDILPYRQGPKTACTFCPYKPVCQFDPQMEGAGIRTLHPRGRDEIWQALEQAAAGSEPQKGGGFDEYSVSAR